jgi:dTDP-4-dehydrorhamnose reductase
LLTEARGVVHVSGGGECSWYEFAREILSAAGQDPVLVESTTSRNLDRLAPRPAYSMLDNTVYRNWTGKTLRPWPEALRAYLMLRGAFLDG